MEDDHHTHDPAGEGPECRACPVCGLLRALGAARPEVLEHLAAAGRELTLALSALLDGHAEARSPDPTRVQRIRVE